MKKTLLISSISLALASGSAIAQNTDNNHRSYDNPRYENIERSERYHNERKYGKDNRHHERHDRHWDDKKHSKDYKDRKSEDRHMRKHDRDEYHHRQDREHYYHDRQYQRTWNENNRDYSPRSNYTEGVYTQRPTDVNGRAYFGPGYYLDRNGRYQYIDYGRKYNDNSATEPQGWNGYNKPYFVPKGDNPKWYQSNVPSTYTQEGKIRR